jgi:hypothetical protein
MKAGNFPAEGVPFGTCLQGGSVFIHQRAGSPLPTLIYIIPFFLSETATRSRVATPDSAIAVSLVLTLGGGADSVRGILMI